MGDFGRPQIFWPSRRSILYFASWRLVIRVLVDYRSDMSLPEKTGPPFSGKGSSGHHAWLRIAPSSVPDFPELTGLRPKRRRKPRVAKHCAGLSSGMILSESGFHFSGSCPKGPAPRRVSRGKPARCQTWERPAAKGASRVAPVSRPQGAL